MKVPISAKDCIDLDAPVLPAYEVFLPTTVVWVVWCQYCLNWHVHRAKEGFSAAACTEPLSPYRKSGYNISLRGSWQEYLPPLPRELFQGIDSSDEQ